MLRKIVDISGKLMICVLISLDFALAFGALAMRLQNTKAKIQIVDNFLVKRHYYELIIVHLCQILTRHNIAK
jgi:hypothetical protein